MPKNSRKSKTTRNRSTPQAGWYFKFTPEAAALASRIGDAMTAHFAGSNADIDEPDPVWTGANVAAECVSEGLHVLACRYLHDTEVKSNSYAATEAPAKGPLPILAPAEAEARERTRGVAWIATLDERVRQLARRLMALEAAAAQKARRK